MAEFSIDRFVELYAGRTAGMSASEVRALFAVASRPEVVSFAGGMPYVQALPAKTSLPSSPRCSRSTAAATLQYAGGQGHLVLAGTPGPADGRRRHPGRSRRHGDHHRRPAGARHDRQDLHRPRRPDRRRGARLRGRADGVRRLRAPLPADRPGRRRHDRGPAPGGARSRRAAEVRLHRAELRQSRRRHDVAPASRAAGRALPRGGHPDHRGQPVRDAAVRGRSPPVPAVDGPGERDLPRHRVEDVLPGGPRGVGARRAERDPASGPGQGGGRPLRLVVHHAHDRALLRRRQMAREPGDVRRPVSVTARRDAGGAARAIPGRRHLDPTRGRVLRLGHAARMG